MIDIHCHLVYGVDDGAETIEKTIEMLNEAKKVGFTDIILTPHYSNYFHIPADEIQKRIEIIKNKTTDLGLKLYQGNEIYMSPHLMENIKSGKTATLNNSRYVLFEFPMGENPFYSDHIIKTILKNDKIPIMAHPERYRFVQQNPNILIDYIKKGVLFQSNYGSILGRYGLDAQETVKKLLTHNMIHFLGSDNHKVNTIYTNIPEIMEELMRILEKEKLEKLTTVNPEKVLKNEKIKIENPEVIC